MLVIGGLETGSDNNISYCGRLHVYDVTSVTAHPCIENVELLSHMCRSTWNGLHGGCFFVLYSRRLSLPAAQNYLNCCCDSLQQSH